MAQTYTQIQRQIEALQKQADRLKTSEVKGVIERIKIAIRHYGLTAEQLGYGNAKARPGKSRKVPAKKAANASNRSSAAAYADGNGNVWGGRGPRPLWLRDAVAAGKTLEEFANKATVPTGAAPSEKTVKTAARKRSAKTTYRDEMGNSWSGFGPTPRWLREALEAGKSLDHFAVGAAKG